MTALRTLPDLDTATTDTMLDLVSEARQDRDCATAIRESSLHFGAVLDLVADLDSDRERMAERLSTLEQQLAVAQGLAATFERQLLAERDAHQATTLDLEAATADAPRTRLQRQRCHTVRLPIEQRRDGEDYELTTTDEAPDTDVVDETDYTRGPVTVRLAEGDAR